MSHMRQLLTRQDAIRAELGGILEQHQSGELPPEVEARATELEQEAERMHAAIRRAALLDEMARGAPGRPLNGGAGTGRPEVRAFEEAQSQVPEAFGGTIMRAQDGSRVPLLGHGDSLVSFLPASESRASELGLAGFLKALYHGPSSELEKRVLAESSIGSGGAFVPAPLSAEIIDLLRTKTVSFTAGVRVVPMTSPTLRFARVLSDPVGGWRAENASIVEGTPTFDCPTLSAKTWALLVRCSRELWEDASNLDAELRAQFARVGAAAWDAAILFGSGTSNQPLGIANTSGIQTVSMGTNGGPYAGWSVVLDAALALDNANAGAISAMVLSPRTFRAIAGAVDASGQPLQPPPRLANVPILSTTGMPVNETQGTASNASSILLGDFSQCFVGMRTQLQVSVLNERFADTGQIGFVLWLRGDVAVVHPQAIARMTGITP